MARVGRETWIIVATGFNTVASLTAIALWAFAPRRGDAAVSPPGVAISRPQAQDQPLPPPRRAPMRPIQGAPPPSSIDGPILPAPELPARLTSKQGLGSPAPAAVVALGQRIGLNPQALSSQLGDEHGDLSARMTDRLERGFNTATALAKRLGLDENRTQSLVTLITNHVLSVLLEEKKAAPGSVDRARVDELTTTLLDDIRVTCGDAVATEARSAVSGL